MRKKPEQLCINCHFLIKSGFLHNPANQYESPLSPQERQSTRKGDYSWLNDNVELLGCNFGVWSSLRSLSADDRHELLAATQRAVAPH
jgi:hypothetical protein